MGLLEAPLATELTPDPRAVSQYRAGIRAGGPADDGGMFSDEDFIRLLMRAMSIA